MVLASTRSYWRSPASLAVNGKYGVLARSNAVTRAPSLETGGVDLDAHACAATAIVTITAAQMEPCGPSHVPLTSVGLARLGRPLGRRAEAPAAAGLDQHEVAAREAQADLAADVTRAGRARIQRDAERQPVASAEHAPRRHHAAVEHAGQRDLGRDDAIGAAEAEAATLPAVAGRAGPQRVLLHA